MFACSSYKGLKYRRLETAEGRLIGKNKMSEKLRSKESADMSMQSGVKHGSVIVFIMPFPHKPIKE